MTKFASIAVLVAAAGAWAQSACCSESKTEVTTVAQEAKIACCASESATTQTVAQTTTCEQSCETTCESGAAVQTVAQTATCEQSCTMSGAAVQTVSQTSCEGCDEPCTEACEDAGAVQTVAFPADMPKMTYVVGDKETCCPDEAGKLAGAAQTVAYKVGTTQYNCQVEAGKAYAKELHNYVDRMTRVSFVVDGNCVACPVEAGKMAEAGAKLQYKVGNTTFDSADKAVRAAAMAYYSAQQVKIGHAVNGQETECSESFAAAQACSESKATYLVGSKQTECEIEASCLLEMARMEAVISACQSVASQG